MNSYVNPLKGPVSKIFCGQILKMSNIKGTGANISLYHALAHSFVTL